MGHVSMSGGGRGESQQSNATLRVKNMDTSRFRCIVFDNGRKTVMNRPLNWDDKAIHVNGKRWLGAAQRSSVSGLAWPAHGQIAKADVPQCLTNT